MDSRLNLKLDRINQRGVSHILAHWPKRSHRLAELLIHSYGRPHEATPSMLIWYYNSPWKRTVLHRDGARHNVPRPHVDLLEQTIDAKISPDACTQIATFDGSIVIDRTRGEMTAYCQDEDANTFILNLAHDIVLGRKTAGEAREILVDSDDLLHHVWPNPYRDELQFDPTIQAGDSDRVTAEPN
ncbi:MAG: hypothetical protein A3C02_00010 [Candidatus Andersenbacteria bacterium RIFCSPHIGHO2_02_FULL_45_11]|uniref:Uncharacterized protein n=1 Tax=Candidatus Andersenbacteria bacterium RIFCSPHIGHO2_12_FULL_45_11 TaxID=1797281 RepID=A0A1G1X3K6_9BACT|nr:MAG: hypothetical protein A2805_01975 [Candidatus Andersenbacteria bacterium RIFCSPHIGHO2_01_FULL_46_36]OGY31942.1 MAG: hypothetical protein A3C02_00010 [Candidatus Andersenbacteria bacterium RIFCSPHIGHO2_02_FULL_45_11]OGY34150.1 MAG: hypothetical protein A3D99_00320 [Candidatus Andersenbacteria bacterium RIFCSPHIGHO2_12_FULL_45_11]QBM02268.1 hypothetical protein [uncultured archaeon]